jgi:hypothetical protein
LFLFLAESTPVTVRALILFLLLAESTPVTAVQTFRPGVVTITRFVAPSSVVTFSFVSTETPVQGFKKLIKHNILSAPLWDEHAKKYSGILDIKDLVALVVSSYEFEVAKKVQWSTCISA